MKANTITLKANEDKNNDKREKLLELLADAFEKNINIETII